jgi:hypothetical protein
VAETIWSDGAGGGVGAVVAVVEVPSCVDASHWADANVAGNQSATNNAANLKSTFIILHLPDPGNPTAQAAVVQRSSRLEWRRDFE